MNNKKLALTFLKNFLIAGFTIGLYSIIMELTTPEFVGFLHGALPLTLTYLLILIYFKNKSRLKNMVYITGLSGLLWLSFILILYLLLQKWTIVTYSIWNNIDYFYYIMLFFL